MTIRKKALIVIGTGAGIVMVTFILLVGYFLITQSIQIEDKNALTDLGRVQEALTADYQGIDGKLSDWSSWDDTYKFIKDKNKAYVKSNVESDVIFTQFKLNLMIYLDSESRVVLEKGYDYINNRLTDIPQSIYKHLGTDSQIIKLAQEKGSSNGILVLPEGVLLVAARPILTSDNTGPSRGTLIFARYFDDNEINYIESITKHDVIHFYLVNDPNLPEDESENLPQILNKGSLLLKTEITKMEAFQVIKDIYGEPALFMGLYLPRDVFLQSISSVKYLVLVTASIFTLFLIGIHLIFGKFILDPLNALVYGVSKISDEKDFSARLDTNSNDEVSILAKNINLMLQVIDEMKQDARVYAQSLEATNKELEEGKAAMLNILEDEKSLEEDLKNEKKSVEAKVVERTEELTEEKSKLLASIEALVKAYIMIDTKAKIVLTNHNLGEIFGEINGKWTLGELQKRLGDSFDIIGNYKKCLETGERIIFKDQPFGARFLEIRISPVFEDNTQKKLIGVLVIIGDVTEEKVLARSRDEFFSIASHELRTPLTAIKGNASMILEYYKEKLKPPDFKEMVDDIHESSIRLIKIVNDFLNVSRLEQNRLEFKLTQVNLLNLLKDVVNEYKLSLDDKLYLNIDEPKTKIPDVLADPDRLREVIINLIGNSIKFTKVGGVTISLEANDKFINVYVKDTGAGIPVQNQSLLFHKFQQAGSSILTRDTAHGTGLGLYISKLMIEGMGGMIKLENSTENVGSTFMFSVPLANKIIGSNNKAI